MSLETQLRDAFQQHEGLLPDHPGDLATTKRRGRRRRHGQIGLAALAVLAVVVVPVWWLSATVIDDLVIDPADEVEQPDQERSDAPQRVSLLLPNGDRVEVMAPPQLPTEEVQATARMTTGDQPVLLVITDPAWSAPGWPEEAFPGELEFSSLGDRWDGELFEVTASGAPRPELVWRGRDHGVVLSPVVGTAMDVVDALTLEERSDGVLVEVDPDLLTDPGWDAAGISIGEEGDTGGDPGTVISQRLAVTVAERTEDGAASARTDRGGQELEPRSVDGGELYEDGDGRLRLVGGTTIIRNEFTWDVGPDEQQDRMREIMTTIRASWEAATD